MSVIKSFYAIVALLSIFGLASASGAINISSCMNLSQPDTVYSLMQNVGSSGTCFTILADNVTLECNGHSITGNNTAGSEGVFGQNIDYATIRNCVVGNYYNGVSLRSSYSSKIDESYISTSTPYGIAIYLLFGGNHEVINTACNASHNSALYLEESNQNTLENVVCSSYGDNGIFILGSSGNTIKNSRGTGSSGGISLQGGANGNLVENSTGVGNGMGGINIYFYSINNTIYGSQGTSAISSGINIADHSSNNNIYASQGESGGNIGIFVGQDSDYNTIIDSIGASSAMEGILISQGTGNMVIGSQGTGSSGISVMDGSQTQIIRSTGNGNIMAGIELGGDSDYVFINDSTGVSESGAGISLSPQGVDNSMVLGAVGMSHLQAGIIFGGINNTFQNCQAYSNLSFGMLAFYGTGNRLLSSKVASESSYGLWISNMNGSLVSNSEFYGGNGMFSGAILISGSNNNALQGNIIDGRAGAYGIEITYLCAGNLIANNTFANANTTTHLFIEQGSGQNTVCWNTFTSNTPVYVVDQDGGNLYTGEACHNEGNIWGNVLDGSVVVKGANKSVGFPSLYVGAYGSGYPYNQQTSQGRLEGNISDYAPLTPFVAQFGSLTVGAYPANSGTVTGSASNFLVPATLPIGASANIGYNFTNWTSSGNCTVSNPTQKNTTVAVNGKCKVTANFVSVLARCKLSPSNACT